MKVAAIVHFATPYRSAGSETVLHLMLKSLVEAGHEVKCWVTDVHGQREMTYEGVHLIPVRNAVLALNQARRWAPNVVISHHQNSAIVQRYTQQWESAMVYLTHNDMDVNKNPLRLEPDLVIHNSEWVQESLNQKFPHESSEQMVIHPPLDCSRHHVPRTGDSVTLINVNEHKGGRIFYALAARMPDVRFLAVLGGHGVQVRPPRTLSNLTVGKHNPDLKPVWAQTALLLMPSIYESYGLVGIEAGCSGIPTLGNITPGLRESLGTSALFVSWAHENLPRTQTDYWNQKEWQSEWANPSEKHLNEWEAAIRIVLNEDYETASKAALDNSQSKCEQTETDLSDFVRIVENLQPSVKMLAR